uniref:Ubiquitin-like protease family profile domain-containing protein n=1 Tax=Ditylenchus dipsaci TaxID=166011 RepID=A0A915DPX4_9BILA
MSTATDNKPHLHTDECNYLVRLLLDCRASNNIIKQAFGACGYWHEAVAQCTRKERELKRKTNSRQARKERIEKLPEKYYTPALIKLKEQGVDFSEPTNTRANNAAEAYHSFLKRRHGALRRPGNSLLFAFLQKLQFQQSVWVVRIESGSSVKKKNRKYEKIIISCGNRGKSSISRPGTGTSHLVPDVNQTGLRTKEAERAAKNRKRRATDPVPVKEKKPKKESRKSTGTIDVTGLGIDRVLANGFGIQLKQGDLEPGQCLNDVIINYYLQLVAEKTAEISLLYTQFADKGPSTVLKWTKDVDLFSFDVLLLPIHFPGHWTLAMVLNKRKRIDYYDSMGGNAAQHMEQVKYGYGPIPAVYGDARASSDGSNGGPLPATAAAAEEWW